MILLFLATGEYSLFELGMQKGSLDEHPRLLICVLFLDEDSMQCKGVGDV